MAEDKKEKELDLEEQVDEESSESASPKPKKKLLFIGAGLALVAALAGGATMFIMGEDPAPGDELADEIEIPQTQAEYLEFDPPFVINLPDRGRQRFLQATVTVMTRNHAAYLTIEKHMPAMRHSISTVLGAQTIASIQSPGGIEEVRQEATIELNKILLEEFGSEEIEAVLFTAFVMQ